MNADCIIGPPRGGAVIGRVVVGALDLVADCANRAVGPRAESPDSARLQAEVKEVSPMRLAMRTPRPGRSVMPQQPQLASPPP